MGGEMTPLPPACVDALKGLMPASVREPAARAVLDAFVAGEPSGPWRVKPGPGTHPRHFDVDVTGMKAGMPGYARYPDEAMARAVANVLNYLEAKGE